MKTRLIVIAAIAAILAGCNPQETPSLSVDKTSLSFAPAGGSEGFQISSNTSWSISSDGTGWCTVSQTSGEGGAAIIVQVQPFTEAIARSATITVTTPSGLIQTIAVVQTPPAPPANPDEQSVAVIAA